MLGFIKCITNCLAFEPGVTNNSFLYVMDNSDEGDPFDEYLYSMNPNVKMIRLRGKDIPIPQDPAYYTSKHIELATPPEISIHEFLRGIKDEYRKDLLATEEEIRVRIPKDLPKIIELDECFHPDLADGVMPSQCETFQMIGKVLETGKVKYYSPTQEPNNHWKHWPEGGTN